MNFGSMSQQTKKYEQLILGLVARSAPLTPMTRPQIGLDFESEDDRLLLFNLLRNDNAYQKSEGFVILDDITLFQFDINGTSYFIPDALEVPLRRRDCLLNLLDLNKLIYLCENNEEYLTGVSPTVQTKIFIKKSMEALCQEADLALLVGGRETLQEIFQNVSFPGNQLPSMSYISGTTTNDHGYDTSDGFIDDDDILDYVSEEEEEEETVTVKRRRVKAKPAEDKKKEDLECPVCLVNEKNVILDDCGHTLCAVCVDKLETHECPVCRVRITKAIPFFL